jgi:hypothetical protein
MLTKAELTLQKTSNFKFKLILILVAAFRVGISPIGPEWVGWLADAAKAFPDSANYISYSPLPVLIMKLIGAYDPYLWWAIWLAIDLIWIVFCLRLIEKIYSEHARVLQTIFMMSQLVTVNLTMIGHYDNLILMATTMLLFFQNRFVYLLSALIAGGANPYLSFATGVCFIFYSYATRKRHHFEIALSWSVVSLMYLVGTNLFLTSPTSGTRQSIVLGQVEMVLEGVAGVWWYVPLSVYGALAIIFLVVIKKYLSNNSDLKFSRLFALLIATSIIPIMMAYLILDHTRIGVAAGSAILLMFIFEEISTIKDFFARFNLQPISTLLIIWLLTYPVIIDSGGVFRLPYEKFASVLW